MNDDVTTDEIPPEPERNRKEKTKIAGVIIAAFLIVAAGFYAHEKMKNTPVPSRDTRSPAADRGSSTSSVEEPSATAYANAAYGIAFVYPNTLYLKESFAGIGDDARLEVTLVEDTLENRNAVNGNAAVPREAPAGIMIEAYKTGGDLAPADAAALTSTWNVATGSTTPIEIAGEEGIEYPWSGLYEGKTAIVVRGGYVYAFSVSWLTPDDTIIADFDSLMRTVSFENSTT